jgi:hypothetical protein
VDGINQLATERVTTLMSVPEKSALERKARKAGVSVGEFVRRSVDFYDPDEVAALAQLADLAAELARSNREATAALDKALASVAETCAQLERRLPA